MKNWLITLLAVFALFGMNDKVNAQDYTGTSVTIANASQTFLNGTYEYVETDSNNKPVYQHPTEGVKISYTDEMWNGEFKWRIWNEGMITSYFMYNDNNTDLVPQEGWMTNSGAETATFSGTGTQSIFEGTSVTIANASQTFLNGTYEYVETDSNNKPVYQHPTEGVKISYTDEMWNGEFKWRIWNEGMITSYFMYNDNNTDLVPQNGWMTNSGAETATFSGTGTVDNVPTAIEDVVPDFELKAYPNPATDFVNIELTNSANLTIYNAAGSVVRSTVLYAGLNQVTISNLSNGVYLFSIEIEGETEIIRIVKN